MCLNQPNLDHQQIFNPNSSVLSHHAISKVKVSSEKDINRVSPLMRTFDDIEVRFAPGICGIYKMLSLKRGSIYPVSGDYCLWRAVVRVD